MDRELGAQAKFLVTPSPESRKEINKYRFGWWSASRKKCQKPMSRRIQPNVRKITLRVIQYSKSHGRY
jgi:hypothetical protein